MARVASSREAEGQTIRRVIAAKLENRARKSLRQARRDGASHRGGAGRGNEPHAPILDKLRADVVSAWQHLRETLRCLAVARGGALEKRLCRERREWGFFRRFP